MNASNIVNRTLSLLLLAASVAILSAAVVITAPATAYAQDYSDPSDIWIDFGQGCGYEDEDGWIDLGFGFGYDDEDGFWYEGESLLEISNTFGDGNEPIFEPETTVQQCSTTEEAIAYLRAAMTDREENVSFVLDTGSNYKDLALGLFYAAMDEDGDPHHGDYLRYVWSNMSCKMRYRTNDQGYRVTYTYAISYKTTADEERALDSRVTTTLNGMNLSGKSDYAKAKAVYDYICSRVTYDYAHVSDASYKLQYTAYAAMFHGTAVCQGYSSLFYLMAEQAGLDVRIVAGIGDGDNHSWNIVKLGNTWYNVDATWDAARYQEGRAYAYFLKSDADFTGHYRGTHGESADYAIDYTSGSFYAEHPMATVSYGGSAGVWKKDSNGWWYQRANGTYPVSCWEQIDGYWYLFNASGYMRTGWVQVNGAWYYLGSDGAMRTGWLNLSGKWRYLGSDGVMRTGWVQVNGAWYYLNPANDGIMHTGWLNQGGNWRYLGSDGAMRTGWLSYAGNWYYLDPANDGIMHTGWLSIGAARYYLDPAKDGAMATGWKWVGGSCYYFDPANNGIMATDTWIDGSYVDADGKWIPDYAGSGESIEDAQAA